MKLEALAIFTAVLAACAYDGAPAFGDGTGGVGASGQPGASSGSVPVGSSGAGGPTPTCGATLAIPCNDGAECLSSADCRNLHCVQSTCVAATGDDGIANGTETDIDCGGGGPTCAIGKGCKAGTDCAAGVCSPAGLCLPPTPTDTVKNGTETDVDCGGADAPPCAEGKVCDVSADCGSHGCGYQKACVAVPSCAPHEGGDTCGPGEIDDPAAQHESCCIDIALPTAGTRLDKYVVTAGRMRSFIEYTQGDVAGFIEANKPAWWDAGYGSVALPATLAEAVLELSADGASAECSIGTTAAESGTRTYWLSDADNDITGSGRQGYPQLVLDTKALNCVRRPMLAALCAFDGKRVPTATELQEAWGGTGRRYPWGSADYESDFAIHFRAYSYPGPLADFVADQSYQMAPPGRRPLGNSPLGFADMAGLLYEHAEGAQTIGKGSFENHAIQENVPAIENFTITRKYGAIGGRCAHD